MTIDKRALVVIPARGGSKRLPRKNILDLGGKPLIHHTIEAAKGAGCFAGIVVSTEDEEIAAVAQQIDGITVDNRSVDLAGDTVKIWDVIHEIASRPSVRESYNVIALMLPTAPFRRAGHIRQGFNLLTPEIDNVVSFAPYDFPPQMAVSFSDDAVMAPVYHSCPLLTGNTRSQDQKEAYRPNGSFYLSWIESYLDRKSFYTGVTRGVTMTRMGSTDIDTKDDLALARLMVQAGLAESDFL